jgi:hypothetical protein
MTQDEIDTMWQQAMRQSIEEGEMFTRYHFAKLVAAKEREACAKACEDGINNATDWDSSAWDQACENRAYAIRARGEA